MYSALNFLNFSVQKNVSVGLYFNSASHGFPSTNPRGNTGEAAHRGEKAGPKLGPLWEGKKKRKYILKQMASRRESVFGNKKRKPQGEERKAVKEKQPREVVN